MKHFNKVEPIKSWSAQWMIEHELWHPPVTLVDFTKTTAEKLELKLEKLHHKLAKQNANYKSNQLQLLADLAKSKPRFNVFITTL
jgi:hypothetical protein